MGSPARSLRQLVRCGPPEGDLCASAPALSVNCFCPFFLLNSLTSLIFFFSQSTETVTVASLGFRGGFGARRLASLSRALRTAENPGQASIASSALSLNRPRQPNSLSFPRTLQTRVPMNHGSASFFVSGQRAICASRLTHVQHKIRLHSSSPSAI